MSRKKEMDQPLSQEEQSQVQHLLEDYQRIALNLQQSSDQVQIERALADINVLTEQAQITLLKALAKENTTEAADVLLAVNTVSPLKEARKEARRSLIRLESSKKYPRWTPPITQSPVVQVSVEHAPRFWKGIVTQSREEGELHLVLSWEQGYDYGNARMLVFLLDYWSDGVKEVFVETGSKHVIEERIATAQAKITAPLTDCTLAEGKRLLEEALSINAWRDTTPHKDYRTHLHLINSLILEASDLGEDRGRTFINPELTEEESAINFSGAWSMGDYGLAYDLLTSDSSVRDGLSRIEWIERHRAWSDEAHPARMELGFVHEREPQQSALWLPTSITSRQPTRKAVELGWSLELTETPLSGTLREMPLGTVVNKITGRHWFWTSYTLVREEKLWRIQAISDEGANVQRLSINELQKHVKEDEEGIEKALEKRETDPQAAFEEIAWRITQLLHLYDALMVHLPLDPTICENAYGRSIAAGNPERSLVYLERMARFPDHRGEILRMLGSIQLTLAYNDVNRGLMARAEEFSHMAENSLREAVSIENIAVSHLLLAEMLLTQNRNDDAEAEFRLASSMSPNREEEASIEVGLGNIAMRREQLEEAIPHYQHATSIDPTYAGIWFSLGFAQRQLGHFDDALEAYRRALQQEPTDIRPYLEITAIYMNKGEKLKARAIAEQGVRTNPASSPLHALFASVLIELGDLHTAQRELNEAQAIDPDADIVARVREQLQAAKKK